MSNMCKKCSIGAHKHQKKSAIGNIGTHSAIEALESVGAAAASGYATLQIMKMVPTATLNPQYRNIIMIAAGAAIAAFTPEEYKTLGIAAGAAMITLPAVDSISRLLSANGTGLAGRRNPAVGNSNRHPSSAIGKTVADMVIVA